MNRQALLTIIACGVCLWLGAMAWVTGYKQGYNEGATTAWDDARSALTPSLPTLNLAQPVDLTSTN